MHSTEHFRRHFTRFETLRFLGICYYFMKSLRAFANWCKITLSWKRIHESSFCQLARRIHSPAWRIMRLHFHRITRIPLFRMLKLSVTIFRCFQILPETIKPQRCTRDEIWLPHNVISILEFSRFSLYNATNKKLFWLIFQNAKLFLSWNIKEEFKNFCV